MAKSPDTLIDGNWIQPDTTGAPRFVYPFRVNGDKVSCYFDQDYLQIAASDALPFYPSPLSVPHPRLRDFYLIRETDPAFGIANVLAFTRTFSRVPTDQVTYSSQAITKPNVSSIGVADANFRNNNASVFYGAGYVYLGYAWSIGSNQVFGPTAVTTSANSGGDTTLNWTAHGVTTQTLAARGTSWFIFTAGQYTVVDPNTITLLGVNLGTTVTSAGKLLRSYTPGTDRVGTKLTQMFYLPGVTAGITTPADITIPSPLLNDAEFLASVVANLTGYQVYDSSALEQWMGTPIYTQTQISINMGDV